VEATELSMAQPHRRQIRLVAASTGHRIETQYAVLSAIALSLLHTELVQTFELVRVDRRYGCASLGFLNEGLEGLH